MFDKFYFTGLELLAFSLLEMRPLGFPGRTAVNHIVVVNATQTGMILCKVKDV